MKTLTHFLACVWMFSLLIGCSADKPPQKTIDEYVENWYKPLKIDNVKVINQWADENAKGIYYVEVSCRLIGTDYVPNRVETWRFVRQGDQWVKDRSPFKQNW